MTPQQRIALLPHTNSSRSSCLCPESSLEIQGVLGKLSMQMMGRKGGRVMGGNPGEVTSPQLFHYCSPHPDQEPVCCGGLGVAEDEAVTEPLLHLQAQVQFSAPTG